jgi:carboxyl-terminal processing protease
LSIALVVGIFYAGFAIGSSRSVVSEDEGQLADVSSFWKVWEILDDKFSPASTTLPEITSKEKVYGAIEGLTASYGDPYTVFFPPVESKAFNEEISGTFGGVGMEIATQDGTLTVVAPLKGSPAERAGVKAGDKVIRIGDKPAEKLSSNEAVKLIRGEEGTSVSITFLRKGVKDPIDLDIVRAKIEIPTIATKKTEEGVFVISLYNFSAVSPNAFKGALREFVESETNKLVLDLRNNPGGYLEAALDMASWFLPAGKTVVSENFGDKREPHIYRSKGYNVFNDNLKMVILVNGGSASASEILAGALSEYGKAVLVGENTFGKGSVQELVDVDDKTSLKVTVAHWFTPNGKSISNGGLKPDIEVKLTEENTKDGRDPQLEEAIKYLTK